MEHSLLVLFIKFEIMFFTILISEGEKNRCKYEHIFPRRL